MNPKYVIISPRVAPEEFSNFTDLLDEVNVDYTDLVRLTLENWHALQPNLDSEADLRHALEGFLCTHALRRLRDYDHLQDTVRLLESLVHRIYEGLTSQLAPLLDTLGLDVEIRFTRSLHRDAVVRIAPHTGDR